MQIHELVGKKNIPLRLSSVKSKGFKNNFNSAPPHDFLTKDIFLLSIQSYGSNDYIEYLNVESKRVGAYVEKDFKVNVLEGDDAKEMLDRYSIYETANLCNNLYHHGFSVGSDPELFIQDENDTMIPAFNFLGSKANPNYTADSYHSGYTENHGHRRLYWDGFQAEFETYPSTCLAWQVDSVQAGIKGLLIEAKRKYPNAKLSAKTVMDIPFDILQSAMDEHVSFGCMPSYNAYGMKGLQLHGREVPFRSAGGHIHFGCGARTTDQVINIIKTLDAILGVACVSMFAKWDNPKRRELYGLAGEYRLPPHGIEYRVLSNAWMFHPLIMNLVFDLSRKVFVFGEQGKLKYWKATEEETIKTINTCDVEKAREILDRNKDLMLQLFAASYGRDDKRNEVLYGIFRNGMESVIADPSDIEGNWTLNGTWVTHSDGVDKNVRHSEARLVSGKKIA